MALIEEKGKLIYKSEIQEGVSKTGNSWKKQIIVVQIDGKQEPFDKIALLAFGTSKVDEVAAFEVGSKVIVSFSAASREYQGKWYTDLSLYKIGGVSVKTPEAAPIALNDDDLDLDLPL